MPCSAVASLSIASFVFDVFYSAAVCSALLDVASSSIMLRSFALLSLVLLRCAVAWLRVVLLCSADGLFALLR